MGCSTTCKLLKFVQKSYKNGKNVGATDLVNSCGEGRSGQDLDSGQFPASEKE